MFSPFPAQRRIGVNREKKKRLVMAALHMEEQNSEIAFVSLQLGIQP